MYNICVFAGTTEGRELVEFLSTQPVSVTACVATEYGETLIPASDNLTVSARRLPTGDIIKMLTERHFDLVVDATHPYAASITESIEAACTVAKTEHLRLLRAASTIPDSAVYVEDVSAAVDFLNTVDGNILLTTGSKELGRLSAIHGFAERVYARVLPMDASLEACRSVALKPAHIIAMQGPFSEEMNEALLRFACAKWLVTKDGGEAGGFEAKAIAAQKHGARMVVIGRPPQREGLSCAQMIDLLCERFGCVRTPRVSVVGLGPGRKSAMTEEARQSIQDAACLIGAKRMLKAVAAPGQTVYAAITAEDIADFIHEHREHHHFAVVMSGDVGFFSGAKKLLPLLADCKVNVLPGLSSMVYLCSRLQTSYEDVHMISIHGREHDILAEVRSFARLFVLVGGENGMGRLCRTLTDAGLGHVRLGIGERLSYPEEKITCGTASELADSVFEPLSVALIENDCPDAIVTHGLPDTAFQRGAGADGVVPMTKSEVRSVCLSKLQLTEYAFCWDIGAGSGSVSIEMALQAKKGQVWAIERKEAAIELLQKNKACMAVENLTIVSGYAPEACAGLPAPTHAFIGGSSGNMREILKLLLEKNPKVRIVATAISLESIAELTACMKEFPFDEIEVVSMTIARSRSAGAYHLMTGQNPIYIFTMQAGGDKE